MILKYCSTGQNWCPIYYKSFTVLLCWEPVHNYNDLLLPYKELGIPQKWCLAYNNEFIVLLYWNQEIHRNGGLVHDIQVQQ